MAVDVCTYMLLGLHGAGVLAERVLIAIGTEVYEEAAAAKRARKEQLQRDKALADEAEAVLADMARTASAKAHRVARHRKELLAMKVIASFFQDLSKCRLLLSAIRERKFES